MTIVNALLIVKQFSWIYSILYSGLDCYVLPHLPNFSDVKPTLSNTSAKLFKI